jgi:hypothetical protein
MADVAVRQALDGGDEDIWAAFEQAHNHLSIGVNTRRLYLDAATLYLSAGMLGLYNGSQYYSISNAAARSIAVAALTASCWARVELSVAAGVVVTEITSIAGETDPAVLPVSYTGAYVGAKGGHYITATKRCIGIVWINAAGAVEGIVNGIGCCDGYSGYSTSDDADDYIYNFSKTNDEMDRVPKIDPTDGMVIDFPITSSGAIASTHSVGIPVAIFEHQAAQNTGGGDFTSGADRTRPLTATVVNTIAGCSLGSNQITFANAGTYLIEWEASGMDCARHQTFLYNITGSAELKRGMSLYSSAANDVNQTSSGSYLLQNVASITIELRHRCETTKAAEGMGVACNFGTEVYARVKITKLA